jgi:hypothetical protein
MDPYFKVFAKYGWRDIYYANPFLPDDLPKCDEPNRWHVGVRTGPNKEHICIKECSTEKEAQTYKSPSGSSINEAIIKAVKLYNSLVEK